MTPLLSPDAPAAITHPLAAFGLDMLARGAARLRGERIALAEAGEGAQAPVTYRDLDRLTLAFSAHAAECGLKPGERILVVGAARIGVATAILGALGARLEPVIAPAHLTPGALAFLAQSCGATAVVGPTRYGAFDAESAMMEIAASAPDIRILGSLGPGVCDGAVDFSPAGLAETIDVAPHGPSRGAPPRIGLVLQPDQKTPRATFLTQSDIVAQALDFASRLRLTAEQPILSTLSPASLAGLVAGPVAALLAGAPLTWFGPFEAKGFVALVDDLAPCHLVAPEAIASDLDRARILTKEQIESLALARAADATGESWSAPAPVPVTTLTTLESGRLDISLAGAASV